MIEKFLLILSACVFLTAGFCFCYWYTTYLKKKNRKGLSDVSFEDLLGILSVIIATETQEYDNELLIGNRPITNQQYEAFYKDLCGKIIENISTDLMKALSQYTTEDNIIRIVARQVKSYLKTKINGTF